MATNSGNTASKKLNISNGATAVDRLSTLPDPILHHILSFLPTTKDAIKTSSLSKSWQFIWTSVPTLVFSSSSTPNFSHTDFAQSVEKTLTLHSAPAITEFIISFPYHDSVKSQIDSWVRFAVARRVKHLHLDFDVNAGMTNFLLPCFLYSNPDLTQLTIRECIFSPPEIVHLPLLTNLSLQFTELTDEAVTKLLSGCLSLESLELSFCSGFEELNIRSASLKRLMFNGYILGSLKEISAPNLEWLSLLGNEWSLSGYKLIASSSVVEVELQFSWGQRFLLGNNPPKEHRRIRKRFKELLRNFPNLENLTLRCFNHPKGNEVLQGDIVDAGKAFWRLEGKISTFTCLKKNLKRVEIIGFAPNKVGWEIVDPLVEFLLNNALVLEKIAICVQGYGVHQPRSCLKVEESWKFIDATQEILSYKRASPSAVVLFETSFK